MLGLRSRNHQNQDKWQKFLNAAKHGVFFLNAYIKAEGLPPNYVYSEGKTLCDMLKEAEIQHEANYSASIKRLGELGGTYSSTLYCVAAVIAVSAFIFAGPLASVFMDNVKTNTKAQYVLGFEYNICSFSKIVLQERIDFSKIIEKIGGKGAIGIFFAALTACKFYTDNKEAITLCGITDIVYQNVHSYLYSHDKQIQEIK